MAAEQRAAPAALGSAPVGVGVGGVPSAPAPDVCRTVMVIDGSYSYIGARNLPGGRIDFVRFRDELERQAACRFRECWFFDHENVRFKSPSQAQSVQYTALKLAPPHGPQFQLKLYAMKKYSCHCRRCGHSFTQNVQKGVDNGIATKILSLAYENVCDRFILFAGDGDFYDSLNQIKNVLRKDLWVVGYRETVSADLQQLASHVIWLDDLWPAVQVVQPQPVPASQTSNGSVTLASEVHVPPPAEQSRPARETAEASTSARRVRLERQANADMDGDSNSNGKSRGKARNRRRHDQNRRNRSRSRSRSRSPRRQTSTATTEENDEHPLFYFDTGAPKKERQRSRAPAEPSPSPSSAPPSKQERRDTDGGRRGKRKRQESPILAFELSDMSSEEDEQHPVLQRGKTDPPSTQNGGITVINLASDSE